MHSAWSSSLNYQGQKRSLIEWDKIDADEWLSLTNWKIETALKDESPDWEKILRERRLVQLMGKALDCVGECRVYQGTKFNSVSFRSSLYQGDDIVTLKESYLWIYLMDGTMVRLSPESSITLREINIGTDEIMVQVRLNSGNILWLGRNQLPFEVTEGRETDTLFLSLSYYEANPELKMVDVNQADLFSWIEKDRTFEKQLERLNQLVEENNKIVNKKKSFAFLVMPNGSVFGEDIQAEFIILLGGESYIKSRLPEHMNQKTDSSNPSAPLTFYYRGFENTREMTLAHDQWYEIEPRGRSISPYKAPSLFGIGEFITARIPSILIARELMMKEYSEFVFTEMSAYELAFNHGYRQWGSFKDASSDMSQRLNFLKEHTRRVETTQLLTSARFKDILEKRGEKMDSMTYSARFFNLALVDYNRKRETIFYTEGEAEEILNSTQKPLWKIMQSRRKPSIKSSL